MHTIRRAARLLGLVAVASATTLMPTRAANADAPPEPWPKGQLVDYISSERPTLGPTRIDDVVLMRDGRAGLERYRRRRITERGLCLPASRVARLRRLFRRTSHLPRVMRARPYLVPGRQLLQFGPRGGHVLYTAPPSREFAPSLHERPLRSRVLRKLIELLERIKHEAERAPRLEHVLRCGPHSRDR
jgi:hypothetical protein